MKFLLNKVILIIFAIFICNFANTKGLKKKFHIKIREDSKGPRDGCVMLYSKCSYQGESIELCEDVYDFKLIKSTSWSGGYPTCMKFGKYITTTLFYSAKYTGKSYIATKDIDCFKNTGFKNDPGSLQINHIREFTVDKDKLEFLNQERKKQDDEEMKQIDIDRKAIFLRREGSNDFIYDEYDRINKNDLGNGRIFVEGGNRKQGEIERIAIDQIREVRDEKYNDGFRRPRPVPSYEQDLLLDEKFKNIIGNRLFAVEQKLEKIQNERAHPSIACWEAKVLTPLEALLDKTKVIWTRTQFNKDPGTFKLSDDRTTIEVMKDGLYRFDIKIASNSGSNIQAILDINQKHLIRFHSSATTGNTQDANLSYYKDLKPLDHFSVFIASTGSGPNNVITDPVNRLCIRKISH